MSAKETKLPSSDEYRDAAYMKEQARRLHARINYMKECFFPFNLEMVLRDKVVMTEDGELYDYVDHGKETNFRLYVTLSRRNSDPRCKDEITVDACGYHSSGNYGYETHTFVFCINPDKDFIYPAEPIEPSPMPWTIGACDGNASIDDVNGEIIAEINSHNKHERFNKKRIESMLIGCADMKNPAKEIQQMREAFGFLKMLAESGCLVGDGRCDSKHNEEKCATCLARHTLKNL